MKTSCIVCQNEADMDNAALLRGRWGSETGVADIRVYLCRECIDLRQNLILSVQRIEARPKFRTTLGVRGIDDDWSDSESDCGEHW